MAVDPVVWHALRLALAGVFVLALWHKLADPRGFVATVRDYRLLPGWLAWPFAAVAISGETAVASALLLGVASGVAALGAALLLAVYLGAIVINLARGRVEIDCGCLGPAGRDGHQLSWWLVPRNGALIAAAVVIVAGTPGVRELSWFDFVTVAGAAATGALAYVAADQLVVNQGLIRRLVS